MATDYEKLYQTERHVLGKPSQPFVDFFKALPSKALSVLDIGCGQGRDALFIARLGHHVTGIDISPTGIAQLLEDARAEGLKVRGIVADLSTYQFSASYHIVVVDRTLHMLPPEPRLELLSRLLHTVLPEGYLLIADEPRNLPAMLEHIDQQGGWHVLKQQRGFLSIHKYSKVND